MYELGAAHYHGDPQEQVRIRWTFLDGLVTRSDRMTRHEAETWMASTMWLAAPRINGLPVVAVAIERWTGDA